MGMFERPNDRLTETHALPRSDDMLRLRVWLFTNSEALLKIEEIDAIRAYIRAPATEGNHTGG